MRATELRPQIYPLIREIHPLKAAYSRRVQGVEVSCSASTAMRDPWRAMRFDDLHCGHELHQDALLGNSDAIAGATLTALWVFLLPIFKELLNKGSNRR